MTNSTINPLILKFYQVYVRSFKDTNDDGIGDIRGIFQNLDYIRDNVRQDSWSKPGAIVLSSIFKSQNYDPSYDVIDFSTIDPIFGTTDELKQLIDEAHKYRFKIILDFIPNHTSDQHDWFRRATAGDRNFDDFYVWHDGAPSINNGRPSEPNNWVSLLID